MIDPDEFRPDLASLTARELEVLVYCAKGFESRETGELMGLSIHTICEYRRRAARKLDMNMYAACALVAKAGMA